MRIYCDIDGVLANCRHRLHLKDEGNYEEFYKAEQLERDTVMAYGAFVVRALSQQGANEVVLVSTRPERTRAATQRWLVRNGLPSEHLNLSYDDNMSSADMKVKLLEKIDVGGPAVFIDDDPRNIRAIEAAFPNITGMIFTSNRLDVLKEEK